MFRDALPVSLYLILAIIGFSKEVIADEFDGTPENTSGGGSGFVGFRIGVYHNDDDVEGNPFLDEELTVIEPILIFDYNVTDDTAFWGKLSYDYVSSASIDRLSRFRRQSGASGDYYFGLDVGRTNNSFKFPSGWFILKW